MKLYHRLRSALAVGALILQLGCAQNLGTLRCDDVLIIENAPEGVDELITHTCQRYARATGTSISDIRQALAGSHIYFVDTSLIERCSGAPGCVHLTATAAYIYVSPSNWQKVLPHELHHILLAHHEPDLPRKFHHLRMRQLGL